MSKIIDNYILKEIAGSGQYGKVYKSTHLKTEQVYAIKVIKLEKFKSVPQLHQFTLNEIQTLTKINNPNVITFIEMLRSQNNVYLVYEFCDGGTLEDIIKQKKIICEKEAIHIFQQIINAFKCMFRENILHRDLKPSNILLHNGVIKVADFGFCKTLLSASDLTQTMVGSPIYMAPEILKGCNYNIKADIWSMGVVLFEMLFGYCPYEDKTIAQLINQIDNKQLVIPKHINNISVQLEELLMRMLTIDPDRRIEWNTLLNHPLFEKKNEQYYNSVICNQFLGAKDKRYLPKVSRNPFYINIRPQAKQFLKQMANYYDIIIWTASVKDYADPIINQLDPEKKYITQKFYRQHCKVNEKGYVKDLRLLCKNLKDVIIIDNLQNSFSLNYQNGIQIKDFINSKKDQELQNLQPFLIYMSQQNDVRDIRQWKQKYDQQQNSIIQQFQNKNYQTPSVLVQLHAKTPLNYKKIFILQIYQLNKV
ncbi:protein kinase domain protein [Ichthyophthirius multifiliis]|uniref:Protein kinase domain protein n=1 Tax=Ichthyophthirius multifiliis TaxID=5932 RepID=G0QXR2_ICHMU|nr:protein kinase domain protein [Ichthyophthirius multifiliis]EGR29999.1 protein kinase domain protein [Ichthyophthirius multifiliis]|eukprot:XP_004031235.1 protein kinase domain protein [Ichthyophthirius multifiliis]